MTFGKQRRTQPMPLSGLADIKNDCRQRFFDIQRQRDKMTTIRYPEANDLRNLVKFCEHDGTIWLGESRMILMHTAALGTLRKELVDSVGKEQTRRILTRMGYASGVRDAELAKRIRAHQSLQDAFFTGPQLHMLEGIVRVTPVSLKMDIETGHFEGEFLWENSWEQDVHMKEFGRSNEPVCWSQIGYASGYTSAFVGKFILFKEVECVACGANHCRIVGKPLEEWEDAEEHATYFQSDPMLNHLLELRTQVDYLRTTITQNVQTPQLVGISNGFKQAQELVSKASCTSVTVLLLGETGVGKERFARVLHQESSRRQGPFVAINCAALPHDLIESELFGVEKGAFTGAQSSRMGKFERADGGTLFLDEIGELPLAAQAKLLPRAAGRRNRTPRRRPDAQGQYPSRRGDQCRSGQCRQGRPFPLRPLLSPERSIRSPSRRCANASPTFSPWSKPCSAASRRCMKNACSASPTKRCRP